MATDFGNLIDELDRSYAEVQQRMSDPSVYNDHREAAEVGRKLKELEGPHKLGREWRAARAVSSSAWAMRISSSCSSTSPVGLIPMTSRPRACVFNISRSS